MTDEFASTHPLDISQSLVLLGCQVFQLQTQLQYFIPGFLRDKVHTFLREFSCLCSSFPCSVSSSLSNASCSLSKYFFGVDPVAFSAFQRRSHVFASRNDRSRFLSSSCIKLHIITLAVGMDPRVAHFHPYQHLPSFRFRHLLHLVWVIHMLPFLCFRLSFTQPVPTVYSCNKQLTIICLRKGCLKHLI